jgi:uncharacterized protein YaaQ
MKMIIAIVPDIDVNSVFESLIDQDYRVTRIASTGSFLRRGSSTLFLGVEEYRMEEAIEIIRNNCTPPIEPGQKRATVFVLNIDRYEQL